MIVYGVALLSFCMLLGSYLGDLIGIAIGVKANVGGVGIAMLMLILLTNISSKKFVLKPLTESGIGFWSAMYIPIVVAMAAKQNVIAAISSGWLAIIAGVGAVVISFALIPVLSRIGGQEEQPQTKGKET
jgi:malonate transporter MadL subunit